MHAMHPNGEPESQLTHCLWGAAASHECTKTHREQKPRHSPVLGLISTSPSGCTVPRQGQHQAPRHPPHRPEQQRSPGSDGHLVRAVFIMTALGKRSSQDCSGRQIQPETGDAHPLWQPSARQRDARATCHGTACTE